MISGTTSVKIDDKGRFSLPKQTRKLVFEEFGGELKVTISPYKVEPCLWLYPKERWEELNAQIGEMNGLIKSIRDMHRDLVGHSHDINPDKSGRILLPPVLRDRVGLKHEMLMIGVIRRWELWDKQSYEEYRATKFDEMTPEGLQEISIVF